MTHYNPKWEIIIDGNASNYGVGVFTSYRIPDGKEKSMNYATERKYSQIGKDGLALLFTIKEFHRMIYWRLFATFTDHKSLLSICASKSGILAYTANRPQRLMVILLTYDLKIKYKSGNEDTVIDHRISGRRYYSDTTNYNTNNTRVRK